MIKEIEIRGFQSHNDTKITFSPGFNVFTGESDKGKSVIERALRLLVKNKPSGWAFKSWWAEETYVKVVFDNGTVERIKKR